MMFWTASEYKIVPAEKLKQANVSERSELESYWNHQMFVKIKYNWLVFECLGSNTPLIKKTLEVFTNKVCEETKKFFRLTVRQQNLKKKNERKKTR